ncbi:molybdate ABC transporter substrate-binding protein [Parvularcula sp. IMCC14364]|uniref:molybdate ABC transporter substrate-binding protein n=1 Tax=Parvularcula sp. IMCC14364 TaxID=3067902 RepID=UPI0027414D50|nr:molybdate ABC transporter substrate-binding protein [Parvularcula sp. IMCC14364]
MQKWIVRITFWLAAVIAAPIGAMAGEARVAVASSFASPARDLGTAFTAETGHEVIFSFGSTGQLYAQISQGAPFDLYMAADQARPARAVQAQFASADSQITYALGHLVLYSADRDTSAGAGLLSQDTFRRLAIANASTAPYGAAAVEVLKKLGVYEQIKPKIVQGSNIAQTFQFVQTGNAELGFVARSQLAAGSSTRFWLVPAHLHTPLRHDAVLLRHGDSEVARAFWTFLQGETGRAIITRHGFDVPTVEQKTAG